MNGTKYMGKRYGLLCFSVILLSFGIVGCSSNVEERGTGEADEISKIDHRVIQKISSEEFYTAESEYLKKVIKTIAENGKYLIKGLEEREPQIDRNSKVTSDLTFLELRDLQEIKKRNNLKYDAANDPLNELSSHVRVTEPNGETEEFELLVTYGDGSGVEWDAVQKRRSAQKWIALDPHMFYAKDDEEGYTIWPVRFKATSLEDPTVTQDFDLYEDGTLQRAGVAKIGKLSILDEMMYMEAMAILEPDCEYCGGGGGGTGGSAQKTVVGELEFLAFNRIRLHSSGDGSEAGEIQLFISFYDDFNKEYPRKWISVFDHKRGMVNRPLWFDDLSLAGILEQSFRIFVSAREVLLESATSVFSGRNTRTFGVDNRIYQTPDVNYVGRDYYFRDMRNWSYIRNNYIGDSYMESDRSLDNFPIVPLSPFVDCRFFLMDNDGDYPEASAYWSDQLSRYVWTFNMETEEFEYLNTKVDAEKHYFGKGDDILTRTGVRRINSSNVNRLTHFGRKPRLIEKDGNHYEVVKVQRSVELKPA